MPDVPPSELHAFSASVPVRVALGLATEPPRLGSDQVNDARIVVDGGGGGGGGGGRCGTPGPASPAATGQRRGQGLEHHVRLLVAHVGMHGEAHVAPADVLGDW
jgi:hypothetical protein